MYEEAVVSPALCNWVKGQYELMKGRTLVVGDAQMGTGFGRFVFLTVPKPHTREAEIARAIAESKKAPASRWALVLPKAAYGDNRWLGLFNEMSLLAEVPWNVDIYSRDIVRSSNDWANEVVLRTRPPGVWQLWCCVSVSAGSLRSSGGKGRGKRQRTTSR
jgi:hypothetical protein